MRSVRYQVHSIVVAQLEALYADMTMKPRISPTNRRLFNETIVRRVRGPIHYQIILQDANNPGKMPIP